MKLKASNPFVRIIVFYSFLFILTSFSPCFGQKYEPTIDTAVISRVAEGYQAFCKSWPWGEPDSVWLKRNPNNTKGEFHTQCFYIFQLGKTEYDSVTVFIYQFGISLSDVGYDKFLVQKKYKDHSKFELIWDNPKDINQIIKVIAFFDKYKGFPKEVQLDCLKRMVYIYKYARLN